MSNEALWITTAAQMGMGFILPFALTFVAIPLETFVLSLKIAAPAYTCCLILQVPKRTRSRKPSRS